MGRTGTDVAKEASELVLLDDSFNTLVVAISEGRVIFQNIKKVVLTNFSGNSSELFTVLISLAGAAFFNIPIAIKKIKH